MYKYIVYSKVITVSPVFIRCNTVLGYMITISNLIYTTQLVDSSKQKLELQVLQKDLPPLNSSKGFMSKSDEDDEE